MVDSPDGTPAEPEAKRGHAAWKEHREAISDRNAQARKRSAQRTVALGRHTETRRRHVMREAEQLEALNAKMGKARPRG